MACMGNDESAYIIEASPEAGVRVCPIDTLLEHAPKINGRPGVMVKRLEIDFPVEQAIARAKSYLGQPYDWTYLPDNGKLYCSELIYDSFLDVDGKHIFHAQPMNFRASDGTMPQFWIDLFEELKQEVPEGVPGTNPNDLSRDERLLEVYRYF